MGQAQGVHYHASRTVVNIKGVATEKTADNGETVTERTADVTMGTAADPNVHLRMDFDRSFGTDREFEVKLTADERLAGATATTTGVGTKILEAGLSLVPLIAKVATGVGFAPATTVDDAFHGDHSQLAVRRQKLRDAIDQLQQAVADEASLDPAKQPPDAVRLKGLRSALALARAEAADIEAQFNAWRSVRYPTRSRSLSYSIGVDDLPQLPHADPTVRLDPSQYGPAIREAADQLGLLVVRIEDKLDRCDPAATNTELLFRLPRPVQIAVYEVIHPASPQGSRVAQDFGLKSLSPASVIDAHSRWASIEVSSGLFEAHGTGVDFGDAGTLVRISNKDVGAAGTVASALAGAGGRIKDAVEQGGAIADAFPPALDPDMKSLQDEVTWNELKARNEEAKRKIAGVTHGNA